MSGIVALVRTDGADADHPLVERLTRTLVLAAPDGHRTAAVGPAGLGHALLATRTGGVVEEQPCRVGSDLWIAGDVRIDAREELRRALEAVARCDLSRCGDAELVLHAYRAWGEECVAHLLGDFAFVVWDAARGRLFGARDPFGVKLLFHARVGRSLLVSNALGCMRAHPDVSDRLDDRVMGGLLLWGDHDDRSATVFAGVRAVPAGHTLTWSRDDPQVRLHRYWELPRELPPLSYSDRRDPVDHFRALLDAAVADRLGTGAASIFMSGGIDSTMVAAAARDRLAAIGGRLTALTVVFDRVVPDREGGWASAAAAHLGVPIRRFPSDGLYTSWSWMRETRAPEPQIGPTNAPAEPAYHDAAARGRVVLTGYDGDSLLALGLGALWRSRLRERRFGSLARELAWHARTRRLPRVGVRAALARWRARGASGDVGYPDWIRSGFARAQELPARWAAAEVSAGHDSPRAPAYRALGSTVWRTLLDSMDPSMSGMTLEHRHPLIDLRLVRFALALAPVPWCVDKHLFREAMRGSLPRAVLERPKEPLRGDPIGAGIAAMTGPLLEGPLAAELSEYVDVARYLEACAALRMARAPSGPLAFAAFNTAALEGWLGSAARRSPVGV